VTTLVPRQSNRPPACLHIENPSSLPSLDYTDIFKKKEKDTVPVRTVLPFKILVETNYRTVDRRYGRYRYVMQKIEQTLLAKRKGQLQCSESRPDPDPYDFLGLLDPNP
jgi:hypothetical protein